MHTQDTDGGSVKSQLFGGVICYKIQNPQLEVSQSLSG